MTTNFKVVRGTVDVDGNIVAGSGFSAQNPTSGHYTITFDPGTFRHTPTITATVVSNSAQNNETRLNCIVKREGLSASGFVMITGNDDGDLRGRWFGFIAVGE